jgi:hypothetical protein
MFGAEALARAVAAARRARALHPRGRTFRATVRTFGGGACGLEPFEDARDFPALARLSRGAGLPDRWPDVLGIALRVHGWAPGGGDFDLLASTTVGDAPLARHIPLPKRRIGTTYTTVVGYRARQGRRYLAVLPDPGSADLGTDLDTLSTAAAAGRASLLLAVATPVSKWHVFGRVLLGEALPTHVDERLAFDPVVHDAPWLLADGPVWRLRAVTYRGSRRGRQATLAGPLSTARQPGARPPARGSEKSEHRGYDE